MSLTWVAVAAGGLATAAAAPYLSRLTLTGPDRGDRYWWRARTSDDDRGGRRWVTVAVGLVCGGLAGAAAGWTVAWPAFLWLALVLTPLVVIDVEHRRLPDRLVLAGFAGGAALLGVAGAASGDVGSLVRAGCAAGLVFVVFFVVTLMAPFGFGDAKLATVLGGYLGWLGWGYVLYGIMAGFAVGALVSIGLLLARRATLKTAIPLGPALVVGALMVAALRLVPESGT